MTRRREELDLPRREDAAEPVREAPSPPASELSVAGLVALQRSAGNQAAGAMIAARRNAGGLMPDLPPQPEEEQEVVGGVLAREGEGEGTGTTATPTGGGSGGSGGTTAPATPVTISTTNVTGPTWANHGSFTWDVGFATTGRSGWIVQEIVNTFSGTNASGAIATTGIVPHYWEAWAVDSAGVVSPSAGSVNDMWRRPGRGTGSKGTWGMVGNCHFTTTDPATQGFTPGGVSNAGILLSTTTAPTGLGPVLLARNARGTWDSTGATPTHTGTAGP